MKQLIPRNWLTCLTFSVLVLSIPTLAHATIFTFSTSIPGGGTFSGTFTFSPDPTPTPLFFPGGTNVLTAYSLNVTGFGALLPVSLNDMNSTISSISIFNGSFGVVVAQANLTVENIVLFTGVLEVTDANGDFLKQSSVGAIFPKPVPEPGTASLFLAGLLGLAGYRWHQRRREGVQTA